MKSTKKTFGNDRHAVMYISADESLGGGNFTESSFVGNTVYVHNVTQSSSSPRFGTYSYFWGTTPTEDNRGLSASTSSYYIPGYKDFAIDMWFKFVSPGTLGPVDIFAMADSSDATNNYILLQAFAITASTTLFWYFYIKNKGSYILNFDRQQTIKFAFNSWHHFSFSRKASGGTDSYSFYVGNATERHSYWFTGATTSTENYSWTTPIIYIGKPTGSILPDGYTQTLNNTYLDTIRFSVGEARKWSIDATAASEDPEFSVPGKPVFFTPNRAY